MKKDISIRVFADCAMPEDIRRAASMPWICGLTTNPTLVSAAGISDYTAYARLVLDMVPHWPVSFEVLSDDEAVMEEQARTIAAWGESVFVKIPVVSAQGLSRAPLIRRLSSAGVRCNVTCVFTPQQAAEAITALSDEVPAIISVFAGRAADAGHDPLALIRECRRVVNRPSASLLWASTREVYNVFQAQDSCCDIITVPMAIAAKLGGLGASLHDCSVSAVAAFMKDIANSGVRFS